MCKHVSLLECSSFQRKLLCVLDCLVVCYVFEFYFMKKHFGKIKFECFNFWLFCKVTNVFNLHFYIRNCLKISLFLLFLASSIFPVFGTFYSVNRTKF